MPPTINGWSNAGAYGGLNQRIQLEKIDNNLNSYWFKTYVTADEQNAVITRQCSHLAVWFDCRYARHTMDGGYILCGTVRRDGETAGCPGPTYDNIFLLKTDAAGNVTWYKRYDVAGLLNSVTETASGNFIACGYIGAGYYPSSSLIIGTDAGGNLLWSKSSITHAPWDSTATILSYYQQVVPFQGRYALIGSANTFYSSMLVTVIDDAGNFYQNAVVNDYYFGQNTITGNSLVDAGDGDLGITGMAGQPCPGVGGYTGDQLMITKLEPYSMTVRFLNYYSFSNSNGQGNGITTRQGNKLCVTGRDYGNDLGEYAETDFSGTMLRYTTLNPADAETGLSMTHNTASDIPVFSGVYGSPVNTFVIKDDQNYDCTPDIGVSATAPSYLVETAGNVDAGVHQIDDAAFAYDLPRIEMTDCGGTPPPPPPPPATRHNNGTNNAAASAPMEVTPNPANSEINIGLSQANFAGGTLKIYDVAGRTVITRSLNAGDNSFRIDVSALKDGIYLVNLSNTDGTSYHTSFRKN
jgi:hypothetical protein